MRRRAALILLAVLSGCAPTVQQQTAALTLAPDNAAMRERQTRRFDTTDEMLLLRASAGVLQDLGFTIDETTPGAGLIIGSAQRRTIVPNDIGGSILLGLLGGSGVQTIRVSIISRRSTDGRFMLVRATFQRVVWAANNQIAAVEQIDNPVLYQRFFDKLAQAAFLEAHPI